MILDDLFEATLPPHIKASDLPPGMRSRLTMRDVEAERPQGAYRYRVRPGAAGESPKYFMDLDGAEQYAQAVKGRVEVLLKPVEEQALNEQDVDVPGGMSVENRGALILSALEQDRREFTRNSRRPIRFNMAGEQFLINDPAIKGQILTMAQQYQKKGALDQFLLNLGQPDSLHFLLNRLSGPKDLPVGGQKSSPKAARYAGESQDLKKKSNIDEADAAPQGATARTQRMMSQMRARQPQATSDLEALAYELDAAEKKDAQEIDRLEQEVDDLEVDIKKDLQQQTQQLRGRRGTNVDALRKIQSSDREQTAAIDRILQINRDQQQAINDLERIAQKPPARAVASRDRDAKATPATDQEPQTVAKTVAAEPTAQSPTQAASPSTARPAATRRLGPPAARREIPQEPEVARRKTDRPAAKVIPIKKTKPADQQAKPADQPKQVATTTPAVADKPMGQLLQFPKARVDRTGQISLPFAAESTVNEKKKPQPTNPDLWSRAKSAARSKFDVYPSAYANAWAAKWYKSKGGGWRMGKPKKK